MAHEAIIAQLIQERDKLTRAIEALQGSSGKRRGRPRKEEMPIALSVPKPKRKWSKAQRAAAKARATKMWAARKKKAAPKKKTA